MAQNAILYFFPVNFNFCLKKSATKFLRVKTSSGKVVATLFLYLTVHRWIAVDVPMYQIFAIKMTHPFWKRRFRQISLKSAGAMRANEKSSDSTNRKSTTRFPTSHRWTVYVTPKGGSRIFTFGVAFHFFHRRHFKLHIWGEHSKSEPTDDKTSLKWVWPRHVTHFKLLAPP